MCFTMLFLQLIMSFSIGPSLGALVPIQDEGGPWMTSFVFGLQTRYGFSLMDLEGELQFSGLRIDPDSAMGFTYSIVPISIGGGLNAGPVRVGAGGALYTIKAVREIDEGLIAIWEGTYPGLYLSLGRDIGKFPGTMNIAAKLNIINFEGAWLGLTGSYLF